MKAAILSLVFLSGCAFVQGPETWPLNYREYNIRVIPVETQREIQLMFSHKEPNIQIRGYAQWSKNECTIWYVHSDYEYLIHELKHCYYGNWHEAYPK